MSNGEKVVFFLNFASPESHLQARQGLVRNPLADERLKNNPINQSPFFVSRNELFDGESANTEENVQPASSSSHIYEMVFNGR